MCKRLIFLISLALLVGAILTPTAVADTWDVLDSDIAVSGTVSGTYGATTESNDVYQSITEVSNGSYSYLEHKWTIEVTGNELTIAMFIEAHHTTNSEGDDFVFAYSTDDSTYTDLLTVTKTSDNDSWQRVFLPETTSGTVYIRVRDADRTNGNTSLDTIYIDNIFVGSISATFWSGLATNLWSEPNDWWGVVPDSNRVAILNQVDYKYHCLIDSTVSAESRALYVPVDRYGKGVVYLVMTGGTLTVGPNSFALGYGRLYDWDGYWDVGIFNISGGDVYTEDMYVGVVGEGTINMIYCDIDVNGTLHIPKNSQGSGTVNMCCATLEANSISMNSNGLVDIWQLAVVVIDGNVAPQVQGYIDNGWITGYGGDGWVNAQYDTWYPGQTMVFAQIGKSWNPSPADGAEDINRLTTLSWSQGDWDDTHEIYFGTSYSDVDSATTSSDEYIGSQSADSNSYDPGGLDLGQAYYWRVDEVNSGEPWGSPWKGNVWEFTVEHLLLEGFESYTDDSDLVATWIDGTDGNNPSSSTVFLGIDFFDYRKQENYEDCNAAQSMQFDFDNSSSPYYSEVYRTYATAADWSIGDAEKLVLFFHGTEDCNISEQMYVVLYDNDDVNATVTYDGDANDLVQQEGEYWHVWNIDLDDFNDSGVNEKEVKKIIIGFGNRDNPSAGKAGTVYFDDISLYGNTCPADGSEYLPDADFNADEAVGFNDLREFVIAWMSSDGEPNFGDIYDLDSNDAVTTCDLGLFSDNWLWPDNEVAITVNAGSVDGNISTLLNGVAMSFSDSTDTIYADGHLADYLSDMGVKALRYPGGTKSSYYHYEYYYMPKYIDAWDPSVDPNEYVSNTHYMDTNELATLTDTLGAEPVIVVNYQSGVKYKTLQDSVNEAVDWVTYCNVTNDFNIIYWSIDNEPHYGSNAEEVNVYTYADYVNQFSTAMKAVDANIKILANWKNELNEPNYWAEWEYLIETAGSNFDYAQLHWYWAWSYGDWDLWIDENPMAVREWCPDCYDDFNSSSYRYEGQSYADEIKWFNNAVSDINGVSYDIELVILEWNVGPVPTREYSRYQQALMQSEMLGQFIEGGLHLATIWPGDWDNGSWIDWNFRTYVDQENHEPTPTFLVFKLYKDALGQKLITSSLGNGHIYVVSALSQDGNTLWSYLINKTADPVTAQLDISSFTPTSAEAVAMIANDDDIESDEANLRELVINYNSDTTKWECVLPPFSLTRITLNQ